ncbi:MAG: protein translocase subunit SecD [Candidatus Sumerlaeia bacterium]|nr:protein translocase subunit SecD [Candidatus Sumerlaeia bacterium]
MKKIFSPKLTLILVVTVICLFLVWPTFKYFAFIATMGSDDLTQEQIDRRNELLEHDRVITLGLDLQGGADFLLAVDIERLAQRALENDTESLRSSLQREGIDASLRPVAESQTELYVGVKILDTANAEVAAAVITSLLGGTSVNLDPPPGNLAASLRSGDEARFYLRRAQLNQVTEDAMEAALGVVRRRVDEFGLTQPIVTRADADRIRVQIPGETNPEQIRNNLLRTAFLEFRLLHPNHDSLIGDFIEGGSGGILRDVGTGIIKDEFLVEVESPTAPGRMIKRLADDIPNVPAGYVLRLGRKTTVDPTTGNVIESETIDNLVYLVEARAELTGDSLRRASAFTDIQDFENPIKVSIEFDNRGAITFGRLTEDNVGHRFAILLDDVVYSAPNIREPIRGGRASISGGFTQAEARDLSTVLKAGALPAPLRVIEENLVGASLGADSIRDSGKALMIGGFLIICLMVTIYVTCGVISIIAMALNLLLILAILSLMGATLTLSGIGGILLTMGFAVDANILIYERLREELDSGKPLRAAINAAFGRAFSVIFDANLTSLMPALVLVLFEVVDGSVRGFWTALAIGLIANLYTGIVVTRVLIETYYQQVRSLNVGKIRLLKGVKINWMGYRKVGIVVSGSLVIVVAGYLSIWGPSFGIDFTGGVLSTVEVEATESADQQRLVTLFSEDFTDVRVIKVVNKDQWQITLPQEANPVTGVVPDLEEIQETLRARLATFERPTQVLSSQSVDPLVGREFKFVAILSIIVACGVILTYIAFRFQWIFGAGAILALTHDVVLALGVFKLLGHSLTLDIVSGLLIILGYSVNDTIVVFDRIREKMQERLSANVSDVINMGINETLSRTVLTSGSTFLVISVMYFFGGAGLSDFALILMLGIIFGTYSSIFVASALVCTYLQKTGRTTVIAAKKATTRVAVKKKKAPTQV